MTFEELLIATGVIIIIGTVVAYQQSRDAFHPAVLLAAPFGYFFCLWPLLLNRNGGLERYLVRENLEYTAVLYLCAIVALYIGLNYAARLPRSTNRNWFPDLVRRLPGQSRKTLYTTATIMGVIALVSYASMFDFSFSRFIEDYSRHKGGGTTESGYIGEAVNLSLPAVLILAISVRARGKLFLSDVLLAITLTLPQLLHGTLGGRRGPLFIGSVTLFFAYFIARGKPPNVIQAIGAIAAIGLLMLSVQENRRDVYIGSGESFDASRALDAIEPAQVEVGNEYLDGAVVVQTYRRDQEFFWGRRYFVTFFVRPIPRQLWPNKYDDMAMSLDDPPSARVREAVGFILPSGTSTGSIADLYVEFSWGAVPLYLLLGLAYANVWRRHRLRGGYWTLLYFLMLGLSVYLPSQSFSAWMVRLLYGAIFSYVFLRLVLPSSFTKGTGRPAIASERA